MRRYRAFLRGINLGRRRVAMDELREHFEALGLADRGEVLACPLTDSRTSFDLIDDASDAQPGVRPHTRS